MIQNFIYGGYSGLVDRGGARAIRLAPNMAREPVAFDADLLNPLRFREAISALHDVVTCDLRFQKRDKTAYEVWKKQKGERDAVLRRAAYQEATREIEARHSAPLPGNLEKNFAVARKRYWTLRLKYSDYLRKHDPELWRKLMPCDPVVTVAEDVAFFECFSKDESAYGCMSVDRGRGFAKGRSILTNAKPHVGSAVVVNCDLTDFFPSITVHRVIGLFRQIGYSPAVATVLALLVTECPRRKVLYNGKPWHVATGPRGLPQGACTSPAISNLIARRMDS